MYVMLHVSYLSLKRHIVLQQPTKCMLLSLHWVHAVTKTLLYPPFLPPSLSTANVFSTSDFPGNIHPQPDPNIHITFPSEQRTISLMRAS